MNHCEPSPARAAKTISNKDRVATPEHRSQSKPHRLRLVTLALVVATLSACTSPLWWHNPERGFIYRGWRVNIADHATVIQQCGTGLPVLGCARPDTMTAFSVNNPYVLWHECKHIDNFVSGEGHNAELVKDIFYIALGINDLLATATSFFPAPRNCGAGTMVQWNAEGRRVIDARHAQWQVLPTIEEWNRDNPDRPMSK